MFVSGYLYLMRMMDSFWFYFKALFFERIQEHMQENNILLSEDLKNIILLMDDDETMIELLRKAIDKFEEQNESLRFGLFQFGPLVMRLAHHLNNTDMVEWIFDRVCYCLN